MQALIFEQNAHLFPECTNKENEQKKLIVVISCRQGKGVKEEACASMVHGFRQGKYMLIVTHTLLKVNSLFWRHKNKNMILPKSTLQLA